MLTGDNALLNKTTEAKNKTKHANIYEQLQLEELAYLSDKTKSKNSSTLIEYLQSKSIIGNEIGEDTGKYQINVTALLGSRQSLGNGDATVELKDVYMLEKQSTSTGSIVNTKVATITPIKIAATPTTQITYKVVYYGNGTSENLILGSLTDSDDSNNTPVAKTDDSSKLTEYFSKGPITDATEKLKYIKEKYITEGESYLIVQYGDSFYKISIVEDPWSATATMVDIDLTKFGEQSIDGIKVLVTPSTPDHLVHAYYQGPSTYKYNETTEAYDIPFTGYRAEDSDDGRSRYYDTSGALVSEEEPHREGPM